MLNSYKVLWMIIYMKMKYSKQKQKQNQLTIFKFVYTQVRTDNYNIRRKYRGTEIYTN